MTAPAILTTETNKRFWQTTGFKPGQKLDMSNAMDREMSKKWLEINGQVKAEDATGALALTPDHPPSDPDTIMKETNARFWAQTHYKPNQKLDMSNAEDRKQSKVWLDVNRVVKAEDAAGKLAITYNDPVVVANLAHAEVADKVAAEHHDAATKEKDPGVAQKLIDAAKAAIEVSVAKGQEAAASQPTSVTPQTLVQTVSKAPPRSAPAADQISHGKKVHALSKAVSDMLVRETNSRFWIQTHYRPGQLLNPANPTDRTMIPVWMNAFRKVRREYDAGKLVTTYDHPIVQQGIANASVADQVIVRLIDAANAASDPATKQQHLADAVTAREVAAQGLQEAQRIQPPTVSAELAKDAAQGASTPSSDASASDLLAHDQAQKAGDKAAGTPSEAPQEGMSTITKIGIGIAAIGLLVFGIRTMRDLRRDWRYRSADASPRESARSPRTLPRLPARPSRPRHPRAERTAVVKALPAP